MFDYMDGVVLSFSDIDTHTGTETAFRHKAYRNNSGRPICFEDIRESREYEIVEYDRKTGEEKRYVNYFHPRNVRSYVLQRNGYLIVDNIDLSEIIDSNPIIAKLIKDGTIVECELQEAQAYLEEQKKKWEELKARMRVAGAK